MLFHITLNFDINDWWWDVSLSFLNFLYSNSNSNSAVSGTWPEYCASLSCTGEIVCGLKFLHIDFAHLSSRLVRTSIHDQERVKVCVKFLPTDIRGSLSSNVRILMSPHRNRITLILDKSPPPTSLYLLLLLRDGDIPKRINLDFDPFPTTYRDFQILVYQGWSPSRINRTYSPCSSIRTIYHFVIHSFFSSGLLLIVWNVTWG